MNRLKINNLEFIESLTIENIRVKGGLDVDLATDLDAKLDVVFSLGDTTIVFARASGAAAGAYASSINGRAKAQALAQA